MSEEIEPSALRKELGIIFHYKTDDHHMIEQIVSFTKKILIEEIVKQINEQPDWNILIKFIKNL